MARVSHSEGLAKLGPTLAKHGGAAPSTCSRRWALVSPAGLTKGVGARRAVAGAVTTGARATLTTTR
eukprot:4075725-Alexandrium_andersonii.AAC.1